MFFNSVDFFIFFSIFYLVFVLVPQKYKPSIFLIASWFFYSSFEPRYLFLLWFLIVADFYLAMAIFKTKAASQKKLVLALSILINTGALIFFKYANFAIGIINFMSFGNDVGFLNFALPIGISFYTFQGISYLVDVYRGKIEPERSLKYFALYKSAFPQLVAGPIERAWHFLPQLKEKFDLAKVPFKEALLLIIFGLIKKMVIADNLAVFVDKIYGSYANYNSSTLILATVFFGFQIYCDFSGYVDIARGLGKLMGLDFVINFNRPYFSASISEFWRRWHISLSSWVRDYIYIPLGGNRKGALRQYANLIVTMLVMGIWHGANWTFLAWGGYHGFLLVLARIFKKFALVGALPKFIKIISTFCLVQIGWVFFRSSTLDQAAAIINKIFSFFPFTPIQYEKGMLFCAYAVAFLLLVEILEYKFSFKERMLKANNFIFSAVVVMLVYSLAFFAVRQSLSFIYFQF